MHIVNIGASPLFTTKENPQGEDLQFYVVQNLVCFWKGEIIIR